MTATTVSNILRATVLAVGLISSAVQSIAYAQHGAGDAAQANNPLANFTAVNLQNYYIGELTDPDKDANQFWLRYAQPFSVGETNWIFRA
jgi:hypothetical protein